MTKIVIEHLMDRLWRWLYIEYINSIRLSPDLIITNLPRKYRILFSRYRVSEKSVFELFDIENIIILDPQAKIQLHPKFIRKNDILVIGGILGSHPPLGRTRSYLTSKYPGVRSYNLGPKQMAIDSSVYVVKKVMEGNTLSSIEFKDGIEIRTELGSIIMLPYRYPLINGEPLISRELLTLLKRYGLPNMNNPADREVWDDILEVLRKPNKF